MRPQFSFLSDTIAAIATAQGLGAIGMIRISGKNSLQIVGRLTGKEKITKKKGYTFFPSKIFFEEREIDYAIILIYKAPHSFTGEDTVEICCHGTPYILKKVLEACLKQGARLAKAGEFSYRAFVNGKIDLSQAESIADLIQSQTKASHQTAYNNLRGDLRDKIFMFKNKILELTALMELELDFSQEDVEFADREKMRKILQEVKTYCGKILKTFQYGNALKNGVNVVLVGEPNVGKSSLLNTILEEDKAIVSEIAGTTRDSIEEVFQIQDLLFRFIDTAGLREGRELIEKIGIEKSYQKIEKADVIILMTEAPKIDNGFLEKQYPFFLKKGKKVLVIVNKVDLISLEQREQLKKIRKAKFSQLLFISTKTKENLEELKNQLYKLVTEGKVNSENVILTNARHKDCFEKVLISLSETQQGMANSLPLDLLITHLKECLYYLGSISGESTNEDILDYVFSRFCIGK